MDSDRYHCKLPDRRLPNRVTSELPVNQNIAGDPSIRPSSPFQILTDSQCQTIRATPGIRRKAAVMLQLSASVPRNTTDPFAMAGSPVFSRAYCSQLKA